MYAIWQVERCPDTGRLHCQGYFRYTSSVAVSRARGVFPTHDHVEVAKGTEADNIAYCSKSATRVAGPFSFGSPAAPGKRNDFVVVRELIAEGKTVSQIIDVATSYQSVRTAELIKKYKEKPRDPNHPPDVRWYHGKTGTGKTRAAVSEFPDAWLSACDGQWFDGYDGHACAVIDDFRRGFTSWSSLLRLLDRYPYRVMVKGGSRQWVPSVIIITCPWAPQVLYDSRSSEDIEQLMRRITTVRLFGDEPTPPPEKFDPTVSSSSNFRVARK